MDLLRWLVDAQIPLGGRTLLLRELLKSVFKVPRGFDAPAFTYLLCRFLFCSAFLFRGAFALAVFQVPQPAHRRPLRLPGALICSALIRSALTRGALVPTPVRN